MIQTTNLPTNLRPNLIKKPKQNHRCQPKFQPTQADTFSGPNLTPPNPNPTAESLTSHLAKSTGRPNNDLQLRIHQVQTHGQDITVLQPSWWLSRKKTIRQNMCFVVKLGIIPTPQSFGK